MARSAKKDKPRRGRPTRLGRITEAMLGPALAARGFTHSRIVTGWPDIAGDAAAWSEPADIRFPKGRTRDGTLVVNVRSGRGPEMQMLAPGIIEKCNAVFGYGAIDRITLTQVAMEDPPAGGRGGADAGDPEPAEGDGIPVPGDVKASPGLRRTLDSLGRSIGRRRRRKGLQSP